MDPIRIIIVDDEKRIRSSLINVIKLHCPNAIVVAEAWDIISASESIKEHKPDVVLLDIKLPGASGFDLLKQLSPISFKVIFITAFDQFAVQAFKFSALDYLLKPVIPDELKNALQKAEQQISADSFNKKLEIFIGNTSSATREFKKIILNSHDKIHVISINEIIRCEADRNYTNFFLVNKKPILISRSLKEYEEMLAPYGFFRSHNSHLVNLSFVDRLEKRDGGKLIMKDGSEVYVSSRKYTELIAALNRI